MKNPIKLFLENNPKSAKTIQRIRDWDESKTLEENAQLVGCTYQLSVETAKKYKLKFKRIRKEKCFKQSPLNVI